MAEIPRMEREKLWQSFLRNHGMFNRETLFAFGPLFPALVLGGACIQCIGRRFGFSNVVQTMLFVPFALFASFAAAAFYLAFMRKPFKRLLSSVT
jgi:hypothetical protein